MPSREMPGYTSRSQRHGRGHLQPLVLRSFSLKVPAARCRQRPRRLAGARADGWHQPPLQEHDRVTCSLGEAAVLLLYMYEPVRRPKTADAPARHTAHARRRSPGSPQRRSSQRRSSKPVPIASSEPGVPSGRLNLHTALKTMLKTILSGLRCRRRVTRVALGKLAWSQEPGRVEQG